MGSSKDMLAQFLVYRVINHVPDCTIPLKTESQRASLAIDFIELEPQVLFRARHRLNRFKWNTLISDAILSDSFLSLENQQNEFFDANLPICEALWFIYIYIYTQRIPYT